MQKLKINKTASKHEQLSTSKTYPIKTWIVMKVRLS